MRNWVRATKGKADSYAMVSAQWHKVTSISERIRGCVSRACRKTPLRVMGCLLASLLSLSGSCFCGSVCPDAFSLYLLARTTYRINLFRLNERTDRGPAISSVCHRRSLGLLNPYLSVFRVPMIPSV